MSFFISAAVHSERESATLRLENTAYDVAVMDFFGRKLAYLLALLRFGSNKSFLNEGLEGFSDRSAADAKSFRKQYFLDGISLNQKTVADCFANMVCDLIAVCLFFEIHCSSGILLAE